MFKRVIKEEHKVPADVNYLGELRDFITRVGRKYGVAERIINAFKLAIDESGTNIIRHAYRDWEGFITVRMIVRDTSVTVCMIDQGHRFDPRSVRDPDLQRYVDIGKKGGLGIFIIRRVIDKIEYRKTVEGNELRLTKEREFKPKRRLAFPEMTVTMKTRYSLIASGILTVLIIAGFVWNLVNQQKSILQENLQKGREIARIMATASFDYLLVEDNPELARIASEIHREHSPFVVEALVVDSTRTVQGVVRMDLIFETYQMPSDRKRIHNNIFQYQAYDGKKIYDIAEPVMTKTGRMVGQVHIHLNKQVIDSRIGAARGKALSLFALILVGGCLGVFLIIYLTLNPFKRLVNWVRAMGQGAAPDEMEFDGSDEIGEIAQAFNEITEKFRKSQENLAEQERLQKEMQVAQEIQQTLLPASFPEIEGFEIASYYEAAKEVGGDYFDFVEVDKDTLGIVVADVSGKGVPGSLVMTMIRTALRTEARGNKNAADVLTRVNDFVMNDMKRGMFVTIFYVILDSHNRTINYASAGHNPMILYRGKTKKSYYLNPRGFPIGINLPDSSLFRSSIQSDTLMLKEDDVIIVYTDGITEAMNPQRERFGDERLLSAIRKFSGRKVDPLVDKIRDEINMFTEAFPQSDDITLVAIREKMSAEDVLFNLRTRLLRMVDEEGMTVKAACKAAGVSTSTYYKYRKRYQEMGAEGLREKVERNEIEEKHIRIEDQAKIFDIIKENPEYGAKRIHELLNTDKYSFTLIDEKRIYDELVRTRLNTKELRKAFIEKGDRGRKMKPPGTPFLSLDGKVIVDTKVIRKSPVGSTPISTGEPIEKQKPLKIRASQKSNKDALKEVPEDIQDGDMLDDFLAFTEDHEDSTTLQSKSSQDLDDAKFDRLLNEDLLAVDSSDLDKPYDSDKLDLIKNDSGEDEWPVDAWGFRQTAQEEGMVSGFDVLDKLDLGESERDEDGNPIEESLVSSIADDLLDSDLDFDRETESSLTSQSEQEEGFLELMEGLGFDRREVLSTDRKKNVSVQDQRRKKLKRKQFMDSGLWFYQKGFYEKAVNEYKKVLELSPEYTKVYQSLGDAYFRMGLLEKAKLSYLEAKKQDPQNVYLLENLGVIYANEGDYKKAVWQWGEVLKQDPERKDIIQRIKKMQLVIRQQYL